MIRRVFVDSDVILDVALAREPFVEASRVVLALLENGRAVGFASSNSITNIYYILRKAGGDSKARDFLGNLLSYITAVPIGHSDILNALQSDFSDFEDGVQNYAALSNQCECIVTRNIGDYEKSKLNVYLPSQFLSGYE
ncbi:MAG TPA: PIN domain-containing protein [Terriglobales bacterium]|nr:PIN domain-containing protein [Terriglobales bacterium]